MLLLTRLLQNIYGLFHERSVEQFKNSAPTFQFYLHIYGCCLAQFAGVDFLKPITMNCCNYLISTIATCVLDGTTLYAGTSALINEMLHDRVKKNAKRAKGSKHSSANKTSDAQMALTSIISETCHKAITNQLKCEFRSRYEESKKLHEQQAIPVDLHAHEFMPEVVKTAKVLLRVAQAADAAAALPPAAEAVPPAVVVLPAVAVALPLAAPLVNGAAIAANTALLVVASPAHLQDPWSLHPPVPAGSRKASKNLTEALRINTLDKASRLSNIELSVTPNSLNIGNSSISSTNTILHKVKDVKWSVLSKEAVPLQGGGSETGCMRIKWEQTTTLLGAWSYEILVIWKASLSTNSTP